jgi:dTDP-4-dehydrorhamnose reductase
MRKKLLVTGGTGFLGGHLLLQAVGEWDVFASARAGHPAVPCVHWVEMDLSDERGITSGFAWVRPDAVIHAGAMSNVDECESERGKAFAVNANSAAVLARLCEGDGSRMVHVSSDMVFDGKQGNYSETDPPAPVNYYGETKRIAEERVLGGCSRSVCGRAALIYGIPAIGGTSFAYQMLRRLESGKEVGLFHDQYRSPIPVRTLAAALLELALSPFTGILHLGGSERIDRYDFGLRVAEARGYPASLLRRIGMNDVPAKAARPRDVSMNVSLAVKTLKTRLPDCREGIGCMMRI